jgi:hypothetical protein
MGIINKIFSLFKGKEDPKVKEAKARIARRRALTAEEYGEEEVARLAAVGSGVSGSKVIDAAHSALQKPPLQFEAKEGEVALVEEMSPDLFRPWEAYGVWYYWEPGPTGHAWDLRSVGPFDTREQAEEEAKKHMGAPKFVL